jgi:HlyD family secretion protein
VGAARAALVRAKNAHGTAVELLASAEADLVRRERAGDSVSLQELEDVRREVLFRQGELAATEATEQVAEEDLRMAEAALLFARPDSSEGSSPAPSGEAPHILAVQAPVDGAVLRVLRESEGPVRIGEPLVELGDTARLEVVADYLTTEAVQIRTGMEALVEDWGGRSGAPIAARVRRVEPAATTKISSLGVEEQRVNVVLDLVDVPENAAALADRFRVTVRVVVWRGEGLTLVPEAALVRIGTGWSAYLRDGDSVRLVPVQVGHRDGSWAEVLDGLTPGDEVVSYPSDRLVDGARVEVRGRPR